MRSDLHTGCDRELRYQPATRAGDQTYGPYGVCDACSTGVALLVAPPPSHPDAANIPFTRDQVEFLAAADTELSTHNTRPEREAR